MVVYTYPSNGDAHVVGICHYEAQDKNGNIISFYDADYKYSVGDTLK